MLGLLIALINWIVWNYPEQPVAVDPIGIRARPRFLFLDHHLPAPFWFEIEDNEFVRFAGRFNPNPFWQAQLRLRLRAVLEEFRALAQGLHEQ